VLRKNLKDLFPIVENDFVHGLVRHALWTAPYWGGDATTFAKILQCLLTAFSRITQV
jgi:hypothetical protein